MVKPTIRMPSLVPSIIRYTLLLLTTTITTQARCYNNPSFRIDNDPDKPCSWLRYGSNKDENQREAYSNIVHLPKSIKPVLNHVAHAARMIQPMNLKSSQNRWRTVNGCPRRCPDSKSGVETRTELLSLDSRHIKMEGWFEMLVQWLVICVLIMSQ